jgi:replication factor C subunit 3/5
VGDDLFSATVMDITDPMDTAEPATASALTNRQRTKQEQTASLPWVEKYRPKDMADLVSHEEIINTITRLIDAGKLPHLMLYGPPGTGKTSTILACAHKMYGKNFSSMVLELNASDERGIDVVREQIKEFASTRQMFTNAPKLIVLDEADAMTNPAQFALRRVIEKYTRNARFCIICNYASKIIPALQSRCTRFRFAPLAEEQALERLTVVARAEHVNATPDGLEACVTLGDGDMRKCLNILQSTHMAFPEITTATVYQCTGSPLPQDIEAMLGWMLQDDFSRAFSQTWQAMSDKGLALQDILSKLAEFVVMMDSKDSLAKARLLASMADAEHRLSVGTSEKIQLAGLVGLFQQARSGIVST